MSHQIPATTAWNFANAWESVAKRLPDALAQQYEDETYTWTDFNRRANGVAQSFLNAGVQQQDKVAQYMYNCPQYLESLFATFKAGLAPVNTNYRYTADELVYIWDNADVVAVVFHGIFSETIEHLRHRVPRVVLWLWVDDASGQCPSWATDSQASAKFQAVVAGN